MALRKNYRHIFFDLDHTIWDFDKNAEETLRELYITYKLEELGLDSDENFISTYTRNNHQLWADYHLGNITKDYLRQTRFSKTFTDLGVHPDLIPTAFEDEYVKVCPTKTNLFPDAVETLTYLSQKYVLHLISNGFKESTEMKIEVTGIGKFFKNVFISEVIGVNKPDAAIFQHALDCAECQKNECLMIGDSIEADIRGAQAFGMDAIYFNPEKKDLPADVRAEIHNLLELTRIL